MIDMTRLDTHIDDLIVLRSQRSALIRAEVMAGKERAQLEQAIRDSIRKMGKSVDAVSEASGLTPAEIYDILADVPALDELDALAGIC